ncbi:arsenate reductase family protein [Niameybacter massiliensis]|uniref:arsenate reductase family protein n=1 Tax=Niameybacter massiliensis TaxID=1658108 RepID=UPI0006B58A80|nr:arsenate reductase family protein [Niameybacter massiliensis]
MSNLFVQYPKCTTCKKALNCLKDTGVEFQDRHIVEEVPTKEELKAWIEKSGLEVKNFFNTSGKLYKEMNLKDKVGSFSIDEALELLSSNGMLIKRPILVTDDKVLVGFKQEAYEETLRK